ncbi:extracellular solute-binding protein [Paenibacillus sp. IB182496]|uniref:Extracellular solute-binding protein n=1 Tax=Paenibacillus sabuli TaxID=2772509 RepID=A0A927GTC0_9BACL|nr:extracellular solute-binding protein [Paenibacillus sabuli]MBD2847428.1 extracellular solute-binding protein [Paenibacillus sabuli]
MKKNVYVFAVITLISIALLAGCSNSGNSGGNTDAEQSGETNNTAGTTGESNSAEGKLTDEEVTYTIALPENPLQPIDPNAPAFQAITEKTGIKLDIMVIPGADYPTKMNTLLASGQLPDFFKLWGADPMEIYETGALLPMRELIAEHAPIIQEDYDTIEDLKRTMIDNDIYTLPMIRRDVNYEKGTLPIIRMDLLEEQQLDVPTTWDELYEVLKQLKEAYPNAIPYGARGDNRVLFDILSPLPSMGAYYNLYQTDDKEWQLGRTKESYKRALTFYNKLYEEQLLDNEFLLVDTQSWLEGLSSGKYLFFYDNPVFMNQVNGPLQQIDPDARFEPIPILENWDGEKQNYKQPDHYFHQFGISRNVENPELAIQFWNWLYSEEGTLATNYGIEGEQYTIDENGEPQWTQAVIDEYTKKDDPFYALQSDFGVGNLSLSPSWLSAAADRFRASSPDSLSPEAIHEMYVDSPAIKDIPVEPPYTPEEGERIKEINQDINDFSKVELNKFLSGSRPLSEFDQFVTSINSRGGEELVEIVNEAEQRFQDNQ